MIETLENIIQKTRSRPKPSQLILVTGVFDILHQEHLNFLQKAKSAPLLSKQDTSSPPSPKLISKSAKNGKILVVGIESDQRVAKIKGPGRPVNPESKRAQNLATLPYVNYVFVLPKNFSKPSDHVKLINTLKPDILAVSSHTLHLEAKTKILNQVGGKVQIVHAHNPRESTTKLLEKTNKYTTKTTPGQSRGRLLGFPTINLIIPSNFNHKHGIF